MGVARTAPWWLTWLLTASLIVLYLGERVFDAFGGGSVILSGVGALGVIACAALRAISWKGAQGEARRVEGILLAGTLGCLVSVAIWFVSSGGGMDFLGIGFATAAAESRYQVSAQILWVVVLSASLLSLLGAQLALGAHRHARGAVVGVETLRVTEAASAGLAVALLAASLFVVGYITSSKDKILDLSYFRTSVPGTSTEAMVSELFVPLNIELFFPETNEVKEEVLRYFNRLAEATGNVQVGVHDRLLSRALADEYSVSADGTIVIVVGERAERIILPTSLREARLELRSFDTSVQQAILGLIRENRTVFLTVGHGEMNAPASAMGTPIEGGVEGGFRGGPTRSAGDGLPEWMQADDPSGSANVFAEILGLLNFEVQEIGIQTGLATGIPSAAAMVAILGPRVPFSPDEMATLLRYLGDGGSILLALEPQSDFELGPLADRLGVRFVDTPLANDQPGQFLQQLSTLSDRQLLLTNQFYSHASTTSILEGQANLAMLFVEPGYLEEVEGEPEMERRIVIEAISSTFADLNANLEYDEGSETRFRYALAIASEEDSASVSGGTTSTPQDATDLPAQGGGDEVATLPETPEGEAPEGEGAPTLIAAGRQPWRALVFADSEIFSDGVLANVILNRALLADAARWLGRDEAFAGTTESEEDVRIVHTRSEHVAWFYAIIAGAPFLVLTGGLVGVFLRRRSRGEV